MKKLLLLLIILFTTASLYADSPLIQKVEVSPLSGGISFNTITFMAYGRTGWTTCPTIEMRGRKEVSILNTSTSVDVYLTGVSGSTATRVLYPREEIFFKASSDNHIYASANSVCSITVTEIR